MRRVSIGFVLLGLAFVISATLQAQMPGGNAAAKKLKNPVPSTAQSITTGQQAYQKNCRFCHGPQAKGDGPSAPKDSHPSDLTDAKWDRGSTDGEIFTVIRDGAGPKFEMKGFKGKMTDQDIWNVVNYLRSLGANAKK
jgi:mono/diheme cytochrome c family protein